MNEIKLKEGSVAMRIEEIKANKENIVQYFDKFSYLDDTTKIILAYDDNGNLITKGFFTKPSEKRLNALIENFGEMLKSFDGDDFEEWKNELETTFKDSIYLDYIESEIEGKGGATEICNYLENKYKKMWIYSLVDAEEFWEEKMQFTYYGEHIYSNIKE